MTPRRARTANRGERGFTLLETVVALGLLAMVAALAAGALGAGVRVAARVGEGAADDRFALAGARTLRALLERADAASFDGGARSLSFRVPPGPAGAPRATLYRLDLADGDARLTECPAMDDGAACAADAEVRLSLAGVTALSFLGLEDGPGGWRAAWTAGDGTPLLVRVERDGAAPILAAPRQRLWAGVR